MCKVILILNEFFLKYEGRGGSNSPCLLEKTTLKEPSFIRIKVCMIVNFDNVKRN